MAKVTTIIDIGSNSARMAIFQKTSRYGFHLIHELKSKVRISEGSYENNSYLQPPAIQRGIDALKEFKHISKTFKSKKLICVATSAVRDAPNRSEFVSRARKECGIDIKVIDGKKEAYFGALACANLLHNKNGVTIDIGGGSTELACIENGEIKRTISLNLGSIRLKELYFDHDKIKDAYKFARKYVKENIGEIKEFCQDSKLSENLAMFGIGGSIRAFAKYEMDLENYMFNFLHGYELSSERILRHLEAIVAASNKELREMGFEDSRLDSIRPGLLILQVIIEELNAKKLIISGVGVREGAFLNDMLRNHKGKIPNNINPSVRSLQDIFLTNVNDSKNIIKRVRVLFSLLRERYGLKKHFLEELEIAGKLYNIGTNFNFYQAHKHSAYIALHSLNYGLSHKQRYTIATLIEYSAKKRPKFSEEDSKLLPNFEILGILSFILALSAAVAKEDSIKFELRKNVLCAITSSLPVSQILQDITLPKLESMPSLEFEIIRVG
ncbi:Ppx/GppA family phosphatase [Helicobacter saguini]|uniref:Ppx/GppA family phosphatase n=1 Tax=Helicobacter saguini TaxID=1548018 RepID=A0A347VRP5_9HELI|nr:Ppx/GppA phosphatase family protein [Helicobacter saguini]MWV62827.1 Ppx/GppA family phosphatase [Helicobacter saguini]MWV66504.1 Ppx/GppA family phosphatase [Helicobacter saguini]MWV71592.1 Ppx/GppA family phosphatase [Helicobacter saguini]TLD94398.1 Ppx/GppA family phosphatase [Helicobacter saguini]